MRPGKPNPFLSAALVSALVLTAPGLLPYRALAAISGKIPVKVAQPGIGSSPAGGAAGAASNINAAQTADIHLGLGSALPGGGRISVSQTALPQAAAAQPPLEAAPSAGPAGHAPAVSTDKSGVSVDSAPSPRAALALGASNIKTSPQSERLSALNSLFSGTGRLRESAAVPTSPSRPGLNSPPRLRRVAAPAEEEDAAPPASPRPAPSRATPGGSGTWLIRLRAAVRDAVESRSLAPLARLWNADKTARRIYKSDKARTAKEWDKFARNLERLGIDSYETVKVGGPADQNRPTTAILAPPSAHKLPIVQEGGRQSPGDVHLVFDASWLIQEEAPGGKTVLYLTKGLYFDKDGKAVIAEYASPRRVRYFANFFTEGANERTDGVPLERNLDVPQSSSLALEKTTNDKLLTRMWMAAKGVAVPASLAFLMASHPLARDPSAAGFIAAGVKKTVMPVDKEDRRAQIRYSIRDFFQRYADRLGEEVVVKPSGPRWHSSKGVGFFKTTDMEAIIDHVIALSEDPDMTPDGSILIDQRVASPALYYKTTPLKSGAEKKNHDTWGNRVDGDVGVDFLAREEVESGKAGAFKRDFNLGVYVMRTPWDRAQATDIMVRSGTWGKPTVSEPGGPNGDWRDRLDDAATIFPYEHVVSALREQYGLLKTDEEARDFTRKVKQTAQAALEAVWEKEKSLPREEGAPHQAQTDFVRMDVMIDYKNGELTPMIIEINDHDSGGQIQIDELYPERKGTHTREWVATMLDRARKDALKGKKIVVVGAGYEGKRFIFEKARELGVKVILVDRPGIWAEDIVDELIPVSSLGLTPQDGAAKIVEILKRRGLLEHIDGVTSFWEDDVPLTAKLAEKLEKPYITYAAALAARNKAGTRAMMEKAGLPTPRYAHIKTRADFEDALRKVGFPAVLKPASGAEAKMVYEVRNEREARAAFDKISSEIEALAAVDGAFNARIGFVMEQFLDGDEVDVDIVMKDGKPVFASVTDNWPTKRPYFLATGSDLPSRLSEDGRERLKDLAIKTAQALGLNNGVFHIEQKLTSEGPRLIEANARLGGTYVPQWIKAVWGVNLVKEAFFAAAGIPGPVFRAQEPLTHLTGEFLIPEVSGRLSALGLDGVKETDPELFNFRAFKQVGGGIAVPPDGNDRAGFLVAKGRTPALADQALKRLRAKVKMEVETDAKPEARAPPSFDEKFLASKIVTSPRGMKFAKFRKNEFKPEYEAKLKAMGVDVINIRNPSRKELEAYRDEDGFYVQPRWVRWVRPAVTLEKFLESLPAKKRSTYKKVLKKSEGVPYEVKKLTVKDFAQWHPLYMDEVVSKPGGRMHLWPAWAADQEAAGRLDDWQIVKFYHPETGELISGMLFLGIPGRGYLSMGFAAHRPIAKTMDLSKRAFLIAMEKAVEQGYGVISGGADTNFYGYDYDLGLLGWKAGIAMIPHPEEPLGLLKVLNPAKFREITDAQGRRAGYFFFSLRREGKFWEEYLKTADGEPQEALKLMGAPFLSASAPAPETMLVGNHFYFDDVNLQLPPEVETIRRPITEN